jgi:dynein heavy chain
LPRQNDSSGPQDELEYWKRRGAQFSQLLSYLQEREVQWTLYCLNVSGSRMTRNWKETDKKITVFILLAVTVTIDDFIYTKN